MALDNLISLGSRSTRTMQHDASFQVTALCHAFPTHWVHIVIQNYFSAKVAEEIRIIFEVCGWNHVGDIIAKKQAFCLFEVLEAKYKECMNSYQAKKIMILALKAGRSTNTQAFSTPTYEMAGNDVLLEI